MDQTSRSKLNFTIKPLPIKFPTLRQQFQTTKYNKSSQISQSTTIAAKPYTDKGDQNFKLSTDDLHKTFTQDRMSPRINEDEFCKLGRELRQISEQFKELYTNRLNKDDAHYTRRKWRIALTACLVFWGLLIVRSNPVQH